MTENRTDRILALRPDFHRYSIGLVWLAALAVLSLDVAALRDAISSLDTWLLSLDALTLPPYGVLLLLAVGVVVVPYCLAEAFKPMSFLVMNVSEKLYTKIAPRDTRVFFSAAKQLATDLSLESIPSPATWRMYLVAYNPALSRQLGQRWSFLMHRASVLLPGALLVAAVAAKLVAATSAEWIQWATGIGAFATIFGIGAFQLHKEKHGYEQAEAFAVELTARARSAPPTVRAP